MLAFFIWILFIDYFTVEKEQQSMFISLFFFITNKASCSNYAATTCRSGARGWNSFNPSQTFGWDLIEKDVSKNKYLGIRTCANGHSGPVWVPCMYLDPWRWRRRREDQWSVMVRPLSECEAETWDPPGSEKGKMIPSEMARKGRLKIKYRSNLYRTPNLGVGSVRVGNRTNISHLSSVTAQVAIETRALDWRGCQSCKQQKTWTLLVGTIRNLVSPITRGLGYFLLQGCFFPWLGCITEDPDTSSFVLKVTKWLQWFQVFRLQNHVQWQKRQGREPFPRLWLNFAFCLLGWTCDSSAMPKLSRGKGKRRSQLV